MTGYCDGCGNQICICGVGIGDEEASEQKNLINPSSPDLEGEIRKLKAERDQLRIDWADAERRLNDKYINALVERYEYREKAVRMTLALQKVRAFGLNHFEDCPKLTCDEDVCECCDCGMVKTESLVIETLETYGVKETGK